MDNAGRTIAAISTPPGKGGVALIRISGDGAIGIASACFLPKSGKKLEEYPSRVAVYGDVVEQSRIIDDAIATIFRAPNSYTGDDTVEISCHGGTLVTRAVLEEVLCSGASPAEPGEFTRRAYLNGRLNLSDAEAIGQLLDAANEEQLKLVSLGGRRLLSGAVEEIYSRMKKILASVFARIDYPDEDLGEYSDDEMLLEMRAAEAEIDKLALTYKTGRALSVGVNTVICGAPNVGKSSIFNILAGEELAIVTDIEGTTRDVLQTELTVGRVLLKLSDTAGIRNTRDHVEKIGIERASRKISEAELVISVFDNSRELQESDRLLIESLGNNLSGVKIAIVNKCDLENALDISEISGMFDEVICISSKEKTGFDMLSETIDRYFTDGKLSAGEDAIVFSARQHAALRNSSDALASAISALESGMPADAVCCEIEAAMQSLGELDGRTVSEDVVSDIFSRFCVGK
jgi:tRNA modification GTPase